ncbi:hypothetical protein F5X99DRAFT_428741 [Biscogniauxia marginata]|nr:hypothetical protein F5X99DRAFT_428741 [Biscogniauxia marginata]
MHLLQAALISLPALAAITSATEGPIVNPVSKWTVSEVHRSKWLDNTLCAWHMVVGAPTSPDVTPPPAPYVCDFDVISPAGEDCGLHPLSSHNCTGDRALSIGGGHSDQGFVVMVLVDADEGFQAYFGFSDADLDAAADIPAQTASARPISSRALRARDRDEISDEGNSTAWIVENMYRHTDPAINAVNVTFIIQDGSPDGIPCDLDLDAPEGADLATWQWYDQKCSGSDYYASWGYMTAGDAGILTLVK